MLSARGLRSTALVTGAVLLAYAGGVATGVVGSRGGDAQAAASSTAGGGVLDEALNRIASQAARPVSKVTLEQAALDGMLKALGDRWSRYFPPAAYASFSDGMLGRYSGIGAWLRTSDSGQVIVGSVQPGTPAAGAGLLAGDQLLAVNGQKLAAAPLLDVTTALRGPAGTAVEVTVSRDGEARTLRIIRAELLTDDVTVTSLKGDIEVVRVAEFTTGVGRQVRQAVAAAPSGAGIVLDLRGNPGGLLSEAVEVASVFLDGGPVVSFQKRGQPAQVLDALGSGQTTDPLVVLVDDGTASAAEIVAAALQDRNRAVIVGARTYGKGSVQEPSVLSDGSAIEITVGSYLPPNGKSIEGVGVQPDILVPESAGANAAEARAVQVLRGLVAANDASGLG